MQVNLQQLFKMSVCPPHVHTQALTHQMYFTRHRTSTMSNSCRRCN